MSDDEWIYDSVVGFLNSHFWSVPVESFVDAHCLVFDSCDTTNEVYTAIHSEYKQLVEELLEGFTNDIHITSEQFIEGCEKGRSAESIYTKSMFEYVFAAVNFSLFRQIMVRHNASLSLQALQMIRGTSEAGTDDLMTEVMKMTETDYVSHREEFSATKQKEMADLEAALYKSRLDCETLLKDIEKDKMLLGDVMSVKTPDILIYPDIPSSSIVSASCEPYVPEAPSITIEEPTPTPSDTAPSTAAPTAPPIALQPATPVSSSAVVSTDAAQQWIESAKAEQEPIPIIQRPTQTLEDRQKYWLEQKQRLIKSKQTERLNQLDTHKDAPIRPKSSNIARRTVAQTPVTQPGPAGPAMSVALAERLKKEVINAQR